MKILSCLLLLFSLLVFPACGDKNEAEAVKDSGEESSTPVAADSSHVEQEETNLASNDTSQSQEISVSSDPTEERTVDQEKIGPLYLGQPADEVVAAIGPPGAKSKMEMWDVDGVERQTWTYKPQGIRLTMAKLPEGGVVVDQIDLDEKSTFKTERGIGIGSSKKQALAAYKKDLAAPEERFDDESVVAGSIFGGIIFTIKEDKVNAIFVGAAAE